MDGMTTIGISVLLQFAAAFLALRLISITGRRTEWVIISTSLFVMAAGSCLALFFIISKKSPSYLDALALGLALGASMILFAGIMRMTAFVGAVKNSAEELTKSKERYRLLLETMNDGLMVTDEKASIIYANPKLCDMIGCLSQDLLGRSVYDLLDAESQSVMKQFMALQEMREQESLEIVWNSMDGRRISTIVSPAPMFDVGNHFVGSIVVVKDVMKYKEAEEALRASEEKFRALFEDSMDAIFITDRDGRFLDVNPSAQILFGYTKQEMIWENLIERYVPPDCIDEFKEKMGKEECIENFETKFLKKDGSVVQSLLTSTVWRAKDGAILGRHGIIRDITEIKLLEEKLLQSQKMEAVGRLAGGIAHDFNNLLMAITGYDELLMCSLEPTSTLYNYAEEIHKAAERAADLTRQLLAFSRRQVLKPKVLDLKTLVDNLEKMLQRLIGEDIHLKTILDPELGKIKADPGQIEQVIMNLAINARDAMPNGGKLTIEAKDIDLERMHPNRLNPIEMGPYVMLSVSDTGVGIDRKMMPHIFEPFFTTKEQGKGTGLGLSTVYGIIKQSGGYIRVGSEPGSGTTFTIYLPRIEEKVEAAKSRQHEVSPQRGAETILLVEDEDMVRNIISEALRANGYTVLETSRGVDALSICRDHEEPIHLLMTDVVMPEMNGLELARKVASLRPETKVIYMSGYAENNVVSNGVLGPGAAFISKPFTPSALSEKVREVLGAP